MSNQGKGLFFVNDTESSYRLKLFLEQFHVRSAVLNAELPLNSRLHILQVRCCVTLGGFAPRIAAMYTFRVSTSCAPVGLGVEGRRASSP